MNVRAPINGYDHPEKQKYREAVWEKLSSAALEAIAEDEKAVVVILPSMEGLEIKTAMAYGVPEDRIVCVDSSPAKIATSKWRKEHPSCKFYGSMLSVAASKMSKDGLRPCVVNMDFCTNFSNELLSEASSFLKEHRNSIRRWAVTIAKGREGPALAAMVNRFGPDNIGSKITDARTAAMFTMLESNVPEASYVCDQGQYMISRTKMAWTVFDSGEKEMRAIKNLIDQKAQKYARLYTLAIKHYQGLTQQAGKFHAPYRGIPEDIETSFVIRRNKRMARIESILLKLPEDALIKNIKQKFIKDVCFYRASERRIRETVAPILHSNGIDPQKPGWIFRQSRVL